jgi:hypothetical protein
MYDLLPLRIGYDGSTFFRYVPNENDSKKTAQYKVHYGPSCVATAVCRPDKGIEQVVLADTMCMMCEFDGYHTLRDAVVGIAPDERAPNRFVLFQNYPNPFNPSTTIRYVLPDRSRVTLTVFNTLGLKVATLVEGEQEAGYHDVQFDASGLASGVYFYRLTAGNVVEAKSLVVVR